MDNRKSNIKFDDLEKKISDLDKTIVDNYNELNNKNIQQYNQIQTNSQNITKAEAQIQSIEQKANEVEEKTNSFENSINTIQTEFENFEDKSTEIDEQLDLINSYLDQNTKNINNLQTGVSNNSQEITSLNNEIEIINNKANNNKKKTEELDILVSTVNNKITSVENTTNSNIETLNNQISLFNEKINGVILTESEQNAKIDNKVDKTTTVNGKALDGTGIQLFASDVGALSTSTKYAKSLGVNGRQIYLSDQDGNILNGVYTQDTTYSNATTTEDGLMSSSDKNKLDNIPANISATASNNSSAISSLQTKTKENTQNISTNTSDISSIKSDLQTLSGVLDNYSTTLESVSNTASDNSTKINQVDNFTLELESKIVDNANAISNIENKDYATTTTVENKDAVVLNSAKSYTDTKVADLVNSAPSTLDTLGELATAIEQNQTVVEAINNSIANKVDKVSGKALSTNDYTTAEKNKLAGIAAGAEVNVQSDWNITDTSSKSYIKNKPNLSNVATSGSYNDLTNKPTIPTNYATKQEGVYFVDGSNNTTEGVWAGTNNRISSYYDGLVINFKVGVVGISDGTTLNINNLGAKPCYLRGTTKVTTHYAVGTVVMFVYSASADAFYSSDYDANNYAYARQYGNITTNANYPVLFSQNSTIPSTYANRYTSSQAGFTYNPSTKTMTVGTLNASSSLKEGGTNLSSKYASVSNLNTTNTNVSNLTTRVGNLESNYVSTNTEQTITGDKLFSGKVKCNSSIDIYNYSQTNNFTLGVANEKFVLMNKDDTALEISEETGVTNFKKTPTINGVEVATKSDVEESGGIVVDSELSYTSANPVQNKVIMNMLTSMTQDHNLLATDVTNTWNEVTKKVGFEETTEATETSNRLLDLIYPVGSIYLTISSSDYSSFLGGTWVRVAEGRTLFGAGTLNGVTYTAGTTKDAGLPNISGSFGSHAMGNNYQFTATGAFVGVSNRHGPAQGSGSGTGYGFDFDASKSNSIYGASTTVQPNAYVVYMWRRTN